MYSLNINGAHLSYFKPEVSPDTGRVMRIFTWHFTAITG